MADDKKTRNKKGGLTAFFVSVTYASVGITNAVLWACNPLRQRQYKADEDDQFGMGW